MRVRPIVDPDRPRIAGLIRGRWGADTVVGHGVVYRPAELEGFLAEDDGGATVGLITYVVDAPSCEIVTIDAFLEGRGVGSTLLAAVVEAAREARCDRVWLVTTNDNEDAIGWYGRRGFMVTAVREGALAESRRLKPEIPLVNRDTGVPIRDEIEMELRLV